MFSRQYKRKFFRDEQASFWTGNRPFGRQLTHTRELSELIHRDTPNLLGIHRSFPLGLKPLAIKRGEAELKAAANGAAKVEAAATSAAAPQEFPPSQQSCSGGGITFRQGDRTCPGVGGVEIYRVLGPILMYRIT